MMLQSKTLEKEEQEREEEIGDSADQIKKIVF